jgi:membrane peptidoglycan carboxypeptidase
LKSFGDISLLKATANSVNTVYVPLGIYVGPENVIDAARRAGIPNSVEMVATPSVVLGVASPRVIDVAAAYATFAAQGVYAKPYLVQEVTGRNSGLLYQATPTGQEVFAKDVMADLTYALQEVVRTGSGFAAQKLGRPSAGKTGTSQENASAWYSGFTPQLATSVGFYRDDATQSLRGTGGMKTVTGGSFPARIWTSYMKGALKGEPILDFPEPAYIGGQEATPAPISGEVIPTPEATPAVPLPIATPKN